MLTRTFIQTNALLTSTIQYLTIQLGVFSNICTYDFICLFCGQNLVICASICIWPKICYGGILLAQAEGEISKAGYTTTPVSCG